MAPTAGRTYSAKKKEYFRKMGQFLDDFDRILLVNCDNVRSNQIQHIRIALRGKAEFLCGKNTMMKKVLLERLNADSENERNRILYTKLALDKLIQGNVGLIFTNNDLQDIKKVVEEHRIKAPARAGAVAPIDVVVPAGNTGLEPTKTSFFQALGINTKITRGTVEILKDEQVITANEKVGSSEAALLQMLGIEPFWYGLIIENIYDNGSVYSAEVLSLTDEDMMAKVQCGIANVAALSLGTGITTQASFPHVMVNAFKNILSISVGTDYDFDEFNGKKLKDNILNGPSPDQIAASSGGGGGGGGGAAPAAAAQEEEESDDDAGVGGLFD